MKTPRNPVARAPLLRKGGAHTQSKTTQRRQAARSLEDEAWDCWEALHQADEDESAPPGVDSDSPDSPDSPGHPLHRPDIQPRFSHAA